MAGLIVAFGTMWLTIRHRGALMWGAYALSWLVNYFLLRLSGGNSSALLLALVAGVQGCSSIAVVEAMGSHSMPSRGWRSARRYLILQTLALPPLTAGLMLALPSGRGIQAALLVIRGAALPAFTIALIMGVRGLRRMDRIGGALLTLALALTLARLSITVGWYAYAFFTHATLTSVIQLPPGLDAVQVIGSLLLCGSAIYLILAEHRAETRRQYASQFSAERLATLGRMADRVRGDLRATFEGIRLGLAAAADAPDEMRRNESIARVMDGVQAARSRTTALVSYVRDYSPRLEPFTLDEWLATQESLGLPASGRQVVATFSAAGARVTADRVLVRRILDILAENGWDAQDGRGLLHIRSGTSADGRTAWVSVRDTGHGIPDAVRDRLGAPFLTTREPSRHAGLGLALAMMYAELCRGELQFASAAGGGTVASLFLPLDA